MEMVAKLTVVGVKAVVGEGGETDDDKDEKRLSPTKFHPLWNLLGCRRGGEGWRGLFRGQQRLRVEWCYIRRRVSGVVQ